VNDSLLIVLPLNTTILWRGMRSDSGNVLAVGSHGFDAVAACSAVVAHDLFCCASRSLGSLAALPAQTDTVLLTPCKLAGVHTLTQHSLCTSCFAATLVYLVLLCSANPKTTQKGHENSIL